MVVKYVCNPTYKQVSKNAAAKKKLVRSSIRYLIKFISSFFIRRPPSRCPPPLQAVLPSPLQAVLPSPSSPPVRLEKSA